MLLFNTVVNHIKNGVDCFPSAKGSPTLKNLWMTFLCHLSSILAARSLLGKPNSVMGRPSHSDFAFTTLLV